MVGVSNEMTALVAHGSNAGGLQVARPDQCRLSRGFIVLGRNPEHLPGARHAENAGDDHIHHRLHLLLVHQVDLLTFGLAVGGLDVRVQVHLELKAGAADELAVVEFDEEFLEIDRVAGVEVVEDELDAFVAMAVQLHPVVEHPVEELACGLFDLADHDHHLLHAHRGGGEIRTVAGHQRA